MLRNRRRIAGILALALAASIVGHESFAAAVLHWTSPGDNGAVGTATRYDIRRSILPITATNFAAADTVAGVPVPAVAGSSQTCPVALPQAGVVYYFAIKSVDAAGNWSPISNVVTFSSTTGVGDSVYELRFDPPWPNPARASANLHFELPNRSDCEVQVFDALGRRVRTLWNGALDAGPRDLAWKLDDDRGQSVNSGVFFVRARLGSTVKTRRIVVTN